MIYVDTSVVLAHLLAEDRVPPAAMWDEVLVSSRLLEYEVWTRVHAQRLARSHGELVRQLTGRLAFLELAPPVLARALEAFPVRVRTLDALHLASLQFLRDQGQAVELATYDQRMIDAARRLRVPIYALEGAS
jgi:predicted nucleic acid-binding protein